MPSSMLSTASGTACNLSGRIRGADLEASRRLTRVFERSPFVVIILLGLGRAALFLLLLVCLAPGLAVRIFCAAATFMEGETVGLLDAGAMVFLPST